MAEREYDKRESTLPKSGARVWYVKWQTIVSQVLMILYDE